MATKIQLINKRNRLAVEKKRLDDVIADIQQRGVQSMTISTGDGSESATNISLSELQSRRDTVASELAQVRRQLRGEGALKIGHMGVVRS